MYLTLVFKIITYVFNKRCHEDTYIQWFHCLLTKDLLLEIIMYKLVEEDQSVKF
jgi:hypothetical protein